jgi:molecular chaperone DnaJ
MATWDHGTRQEKSCRSGREKSQCGRGGDVADPYETLGVAKDASQDEIKAAYRRLARKHHPDLNPGNKAESEEQFKLIGTAYEAIGTPEKRAEHDARRSSSHYGGPWNVDLSEFMFRRQKPTGRHVRLTAQISMEDADWGGPCRVDFERNEACPHCRGTGADGGKITACPSCHGTGMFSRFVRQGPMTISNTMPCGACGGTGSKPARPCQPCDGNGIAPRHVSLDVDIPPGVEHGSMVMVQGQGESGPGGPGDLYVIIAIAPHDRFTRVGNDLVAEMRIPFMLAMTGGEALFKGLHGEDIHVRIPKRCGGRHEITVPAKGISGGSLVLRVCYDLPELPDEILRLMAAAHGSNPL